MRATCEPDATDVCKRLSVGSKELRTGGLSLLNRASFFASLWHHSTFDRLQKLLHAGEEAFLVGQWIIVLAFEFPEHLGLIGCRIVLFGVMKPDQAVGTAVHHQHRHLNARQFGAGVVAD